MRRALATASRFALAAVLAGCAAPSVSHAPAASPAQAPASAPASVAPASVAPAKPDLPARLSDADFWRLETDASEPGGYFRIEDNYTSNEMEIGQLYSMLRARGVSGGVYMGVGPEQNFTYIAAIRPKMAFVVDIRRQAVMQHLMYKAMFEMANDRADFISLLFAKPRPRGLDTATSIQDMWEAFRPVKSDSAMSAQNYVRMMDRLTKTHRFAFTPDEFAQLKAVYNAFYAFGPQISTRGYPTGRGGDFADLTGYSRDSIGQARSFLTSEDNYRYVKTLQERNLIVPVSGDFAGPKAIRAIATYVNDHAGIVRAFYVSNVEQYLFGDGHQYEFYSNVATLPVDSASVFIRPNSMRRFGIGPMESLCPIGPFIRAVEARRVLNNNDALACPR